MFVCLPLPVLINKPTATHTSRTSPHIVVKIFGYVFLTTHSFFSFQSFLKNNAFIVSQYPTPEDAVDFLRLLTDHESDTVICLNPLHEIKSVSENKSCVLIYYRGFLCLAISSILSWVLLNPFIIRVAEFFHN